VWFVLVNKNTFRLRGTSLLIFVLFMPIPISLSRSGIQIVELTVALAGMFLFGINISKKILVVILCFFSLFASITVINYLFVDSEFNFYQLIRQLYSILCGIAIMSWGRKIDVFYRKLNSQLPTYLKLLMLQVGLFFLFPGLINSPIDYGDISADLSRLYLHPLVIILLASPMLLLRGDKTGYLGLFISGLTLSKQVFAYVFLCLLLNSSVNIKNILFGVFFIGLLFLILLKLGIGDRFSELFMSGDIIRTLEVNAALDSISSNFNWVLGIGWGIPYWGGLGDYFNINNTLAYVINSRYDVHNGYLTVFVRMGVLGGVSFLIIHALWAYRSLNIKYFLIISTYVILTLTSAGSFIQGDYIYIILIARYFKWLSGRDG